MMKSTVCVLFLLLAAMTGLSTLPVHAQGNFWQPTDGPHTGGIGSMMRTRAGTFIVQTAQNSPVEYPSWRSTDDGLSWTPGSGKGRFAIDASGVLYAVDNRSVLRSTDDGITWTAISTLPGFGFSLVFRPSGGWVAVGMFGVVQSSDGGRTWINTSPRSYRGSHPPINSIVFNASEHCLAASSQWLYVGNKGKYWGKFNALNDMVSCRAVVNSLGHFYILSFDGKIRRSTDNGRRWSAVAKVPVGYMVYPSAFALHPSGDLLVGMSDGRLLRLNSAASWQQTTILNSLSMIVSILQDGPRIYVGTDNDGFFKSSDGGSTWSNTGLPLSEVWRFVRGPGDHVYAFSHYAGDRIFHSSDDGVSWLPTSLARVNLADVAATKSGFLIATGCCGDVRRSSDMGATWSAITDPVITSSQAWYITEVSGERLLASSPTGIFTSTDTGSTWSKVYNSGAGYIFEARNGNFFASSAGVIRSSDAGVTWSAANVGLSDLGVRRIAQASDGVLYLTTPSGLFQSSDNGDNWTLLANGPPRTDLGWVVINSNDIMFVGTGSAFGDYDASPGGVFASTDRGSSWSQVNSGLPFLDVISMTITNDEHLLIGGHRFGVYRSSSPTTALTLPAGRNAARVIPAAFALRQNYPNPFNPTTRISFDLPSTALVSVEVFTPLGQRVSTLAQRQELGAGTNSVEFNARSLASGVYYYRIVAEDMDGKGILFTDVKKMLLVR